MALLPAQKFEKTVRTPPAYARPIEIMEKMLPATGFPGLMDSKDYVRLAQVLGYQIHGVKKIHEWYSPVFRKIGRRRLA